VDAAGDLERAGVVEPIKVHAAAVADVKWDAVRLGYVGPASAAFPSSRKDSEEARCHEDSAVCGRNSSGSAKSRAGAPSARPSSPKSPLCDSTSARSRDRATRQPSAT